MKVALTPACTPGGGGGHVVRCLALARALEAQGVACVFVVESLGVDLLKRLGATTAVTAADDPAARRAAIGGACAVVIDDYRLDARFEAGLAPTVMVIDDLADRPHACQLLLDGAYGRAEADYAALAPGARLLLGPEFALLRQGFAGPAREPQEVVRRVFICFGLSDVGGIAARAVQTLRPRLPEAAFDVAVAADAPSLARLRALAASDPGLTVHVDAEVGPLMRAADLGVGAGGGMVWERRAAGLPQLVIALADNQRPMARRLEADGVIARVDLQAPDFDQRLAEAFTRLLPAGARRAQVDNPNARCDGLGAQRAAEALMERIRV